MDVSVRRALDTELMVDLWPTAGAILNKGRSSTYDAARSGSIPAIKVGREWRVPTSKLREMVGLPPVGRGIAEAA